MNYTGLMYFDVKGLDVTAIPGSITECGERGGDVVIGPPTSAQTAFAAYVAAAYGTHLDSLQPVTRRMQPPSVPYPCTPSTKLHICLELKALPH